MKKCKWSVLKAQNDGKELNLEVEDQRYIDKVIRHLNSHKNGMMETEIVRKDLLGLAAEAKEEGVTLEQKIGPVKEFGETLAVEGKDEDQKERWYYFLWQIGIIYMIVPVVLFIEIVILKFMGSELEEVRFNVPVSLALLLLPTLLEVYLVFFRYRFILAGRMGRIFGVVETCIPYLLMIGVIYFRPNFKQMPGGNLYVPDAFWVLFGALAVGAYVYGRKKFFGFAEKIAENHHLEL